MQSDTKFPIPNLDDPAHLRELDAPCEWCGASWLPVPIDASPPPAYRGQVQIEHSAGCAYLAWINEPGN